MFHTNTKSLILVVEDPDAPIPTPFIHGIFYNIPSDLHELSEQAVKTEGIAAILIDQGAQMGTNTVSRPVYMPPALPLGHGPHHYHFQLIALDHVLAFTKVPTLTDVKEAIEGHVIAFGELVGIYER